MKLNDRILLVSVVGLISAFLGKSSAIIVKLFYPPTLTMTDLLAPIFLTGAQAHTTAGLVFSSFLSLTVGVIYSMVFVLLLDLSGWRYFWLKSFLVTTFGYLTLAGLVVRLLNLVPKESYTVWVPIIIYAAHMVLMAVQTILVKMWGKPNNS